MTIVWFCVAAAVVSAASHLLGEYRGPAWLVYAAKPLTTTLLIVAAVAAPPADARYRAAIVVGLVCSLAGDIFLMLPGDRFVAGLASFLVAHVAYIVAFGRGLSDPRPLLLVPYLVAAIVVMAILWPRLGRLRVPVIVYVVALVVMAWLAAARAAESTATPALLAAVGAALFVVSDATLAVNRFRAPFAAAQAVIMSTYVAAQILIALSVAAL